jgi:hypothetical protein
MAAEGNKPQVEKGGQGRSRTADLPLFRRTLYQLSYLTGRKFGGGVVDTAAFSWRPRRDSNPRPPP